MITLTHWIFLAFVLIIVFTLIWRKPPVLAAAIGLFAVGIVHSKEPIGAIQISFRALSLAAENLLSIILLIGVVVGLTQLLKDTGADQVIVGPLLHLKRINSVYWLVGISMWGLTSLIWPTPAISLLGAVIVPALKKAGVNPLGLALSLTLFGEGIGLSGDYIIQGAPNLLSKATGIPVAVLLNASIPVVLISGLFAVTTGSILIKTRLPFSKEALPFRKKEAVQSSKGLNKLENMHNSKIMALIVILSYGLMLSFMLFLKIRGDGASALIGGCTFMILCIGVIIKDQRKAFVSFVEYLKQGFRFSIGAFVPIVIMSSFFFLGTKSGYQQILHVDGLGFFNDFAYSLSKIIPLSKWTVGGFIIMMAVLGAMDGSGFSSLPLVGGISIALSQAAHLSPIPFAVLGQIAGIWTGAALIPWGFSYVTATVTEVDSNDLFRLTLPCYIVAIGTAFLFTMFRI